MEQARVFDIQNLFLPVWINWDKPDFLVLNGICRPKLGKKSNVLGLTAFKLLITGNMLNTFLFKGIKKIIFCQIYTTKSILVTKPGCLKHFFY